MKTFFNFKFEIYYVKLIIISKYINIYRKNERKKILEEKNKK